jgi:hypothetical protein
MPILHWAITRSGLDRINIGAATTGNDIFSANDIGSAISILRNKNDILAN